MTGNRTYRTAVGIIGDEGNPANLMFGGVLAGLGLPSSGPAARLFENVGRERTPAGAMP